MCNPVMTGSVARRCLDIAPVRRFEDLIAWQKARALTREVYRVTRSGPLAHDYDLTRQLRRASISVMANIVEGFERSRRAELLQFLSIANASLRRTSFSSIRCPRRRLFAQGQFDQLKRSAEEVARIIGGLRTSLAARGKRGR